MLHNVKHTPLAAAILMALATPATADSKANTFTLNKVTVAASRTEQKQQDVANTVSIISEEDIENNLSSNIRELMRYEPGVEVGGSTGDAARFGTKGFNIRGMDENRVKIIVDGINQANSFTPGGNPFQRAGRNFVDIDSLKRVEVVKGPASTLYGSDALGGIVAFTTKDPADYLDTGDNTGGRIKLGYGSSDKSFSKTLTLANRSGNLESLLVYTKRDADEVENHDDSVNKRDGQDYNSDNILAKLQYQVNDAHRIGFTVEDFQSEVYTDLSRKLGPAGFAGIVYSDFYYGDDTTERQRVSFFHEWQANNALFDHLNWKLDWQDSESDQETHTMYKSTYTSNRHRTKDYSHQEELKRFSAQFDKALNNHQLTYGFEYQDTDLSNSQDTLYPAYSANNNYDRAVPLVEGTTYGLYLQDQITLMDGKLLVSPGVRYDKFEAKPSVDNNYSPPAGLQNHDADKATFRLGAVYKITDVTSVFALYSQGFKAPDLIDLYYASERNYGPGNHTLRAPNADLEAEESDSYELGLRLNGDAGNLEIVGFYNNYSDFIEDASIGTSYNGTSYDNVTQAQNINSATIKGLEVRGALWLDKTINAPEGTSLQIAIAYSDGDNDTDDRPLESIAPLKAVFGLGYDAPTNVWGGNLSWTLVNSKDASDLPDPTDVATSGYGILDLTSYYNVNDDLIIRAGLFNITDKEYLIYEDVRGRAASTNDLDRHTQPNRNFSISATYTF